jgi:hypothetical protein
MTTTARRVGPVIVAVTCVRLNAAYRCAVLYGSTGFEVAELSRSYPTEQAARDAANRARALFKTNVSVQQVLDSIAFALAA